jgi:DNA-directed RNA polymerase specialized sigma24 family protein
MVERIISGTLGLVPQVILFSHREDLAQEARVHILKYSDRFDPERGVLFPYLTNCCLRAYKSYMRGLSKQYYMVQLAKLLLMDDR